MTRPESIPVAAIPPELEAHFSAGIDPSSTGRDDIVLNLLTRKAALEMTKILFDDPEIWYLGGIVLDDGNTSNYHVYLTRPPFAGAIMYWQHDDAFPIAFASLADFLMAVEHAKETGEWLTSFHTSPFLPDQAGLVAFIHAMIAEGTEEHFRMADMAIDCVARPDDALLTRLLTHPYYFFAESVGYYIARHPDRSLRPFAQQCSVHENHQARWAGDSALKAIDALG